MRDETRIWVPMDGRAGLVPAWMVEKLYDRAVERGDEQRAAELLDALTTPRSTTEASAE